MRPTRRSLMLGAGAGLLLPATARAARLNDDGLHTQSWFLESFLDVRQDVSEAAAKKKNLVLSFEQRGCIYCAEMHEKTLASNTISGYIQRHFEVVQLNLFGARDVTDIDGQSLPEKEMARKWGVTITPTLFFLAPAVDQKSPSVRDAAVSRMRGLLAPPEFLAMFEYVAGGHYQREAFPAYAGRRRDYLAQTIARGDSLI